MRGFENEINHTRMLDRIVDTTYFIHEIVEIT